MAGDFNIRDSNWDYYFPFHSMYSDMLFEIADSFDLSILSLIQQIPTQYSNNDNNSDLVINLTFLCSNPTKLNNYNILSELQYPSDHTPLIINITIKEEFIQDKH